MTYLETTEDFITTTSGAPFDPTLYIICGIVAVVCVVIFLVMLKHEIEIGVAISGFVFFVCFCVALFAFIISASLSTDTTSYDLTAFKEWASDTYLIDLTDEQAEALLSNTANPKEPYINSAVYVESFNGADAIASLYHDDGEWRLIVTESLAAPSR